MFVGDCIVLVITPCFPLPPPIQNPIQNPPRLPHPRSGASEEVFVDGDGDYVLCSGAGEERLDG